MEFPRQEYWSGLPLSTPGDLDPGIEPVSLMSPALAGGFFTTSATWEALLSLLSVPSIHEDLKGKTPLEISQQI